MKRYYVKSSLFELVINFQNLTLKNHHFNGLNLENKFKYEYVNINKKKKVDLE